MTSFGVPSRALQPVCLASVCLLLLLLSTLLPPCWNQSRTESMHLNKFRSTNYRGICHSAHCIALTDKSAHTRPSAHTNESIGRIASALHQAAPLSPLLTARRCGALFAVHLFSILLVRQIISSLARQYCQTASNRNEPPALCVPAKALPCNGHIIVYCPLMTLIMTLAAMQSVPVQCSTISQSN